MSDGACVCFLPRRHGQSHPTRLLGKRIQSSCPHVLDRPVRVFTQIRDSDVTSGHAKATGWSPQDCGTTQVHQLQVVDVAWLQPPGRDQATKLAKPDFQKRKELFQESVYWFFDSFLVPLIRSNFHVTETNMHRNRLFYFRHDVWRMLTETSLTTMKLSMFEEMPTERITKLLSMRSLGFSKIRLLPKKLGFRTITNLKRRQQIVRNGAMSLGRSINSAMMPVFNAINHEKVSIQLKAQIVDAYLLTVNSHFSRTGLAVLCSR